MSFAPDDDGNPFAPPRAVIGPRASEIDFGDDAEAESIRREHLSHEASIKAIGLLCYLTAGFFGFVTVIVMFAMSGLVGNGNVPIGPDGPGRNLLLLLVFLMYGGISLVSFALGFGLRRLQVWARFTMMVFSMLALLYDLGVGVVVLAFLDTPNPPVTFLILFFPGLILAYTFSLLIVPKSGMVFSAEYKSIIARTPEIRTKTSLIIKLLLGLLVALFLLGVIGAIGNMLRK